jgi:hypothetical protein
MQWHVNGTCIGTTDAGELLHGGTAAIGTEGGAAAHPFGAFLRDGALGELVFEPNFELATVKITFPLQLGNVKLTAFLADFVGRLARNWRAFAVEIRLFVGLHP